MTVVQFFHSYMTSDKRASVPADQDDGLVWEVTVNLSDKVYEIISLKTFYSICGSAHVVNWQIILILVLEP